MYRLPGNDSKAPLPTTGRTKTIDPPLGETYAYVALRVTLVPSSAQASAVWASATPHSLPTPGKTPSANSQSVLPAASSSTPMSNAHKRCAAVKNLVSLLTPLRQSKRKRQLTEPAKAVSKTTRCMNKVLTYCRPPPPPLQHRVAGSASPW